MTDDGAVVEVTQTEYYKLIGQISKGLFDYSGIWTFPWSGMRHVRIRIIQDELELEKEST